MESIEKLRDWSHDVCGDCECDKEIQQIADEIEREISERYMLLPVDADGVPIHIGDELDAYGITFTAYAISKDYIYSEKMLGSLATGCKHHAERTIEDVLMDLAIGVLENDGYDNEDIKLYADELRSMMGGE